MRNNEYWSSRRS